MADFSSNITVALGNDTEVIGSAAPTDNVTVGAVKEAGQTGIYVNSAKAYTAWFKNADGSWTSVKAFSAGNFPTSFTFAWGDYTAFYMQTSEADHVAYLYPRTGPIYIDGDLSDDTNTPDTLISGGDQVYTVLGSLSGGAVGVLENADASLQTRLSVEETARAAADTSLTSRVSVEEATRGTADASLQTRVSTEEATRATAVSSLATVDTGLANSVNSLSTRIDASAGADTSLASRVSIEEATRGTADSSLATRISTEEAVRATAVTSLATVDTGLANSVNSLSTRVGAEETASSSLATRIGAQETASSSLTTRVAAEETARASVDTLISAAVSTEKARVDAILASADADKDTFVEVVSLINAVDATSDNAVASVVSNLNAEISATNADIGSLDTALSGEASSRSTADSSLATSISGEASSRASDVSSIETVISALQSDVDQNEADSDSGISSEQGSRIAGDSSLTTRVSTEEAARATADSSLATAVSAIEEASGALTAVTGIANDNLTLGRSDQQDMLDFSTDDRINFKVDNVERFAITNNNRVQIGSSAAPAGSTIPALIIGKNNGSVQGTAFFAKASTNKFRVDSEGSKGQPGVIVASGDGAEYAGVQAHSLYLESTGTTVLYAKGGIHTSGSLAVEGSILNSDYTNVSGTVADNATAITGLQTDLATLNGNVSTNTTDIANQGAAIANNTTMVGDITAALQGLPPGPVGTVEAIQFVQALKDALGLP